MPSMFRFALLSCVLPGLIVGLLTTGSGCAAKKEETGFILDTSPIEAPSSVPPIPAVKKPVQETGEPVEISASHETPGEKRDDAGLEQSTEILLTSPSSKASGQEAKTSGADSKPSKIKGIQQSKVTTPGSHGDVPAPSSSAKAVKPELKATSSEKTVKKLEPEAKKPTENAEKPPEPSKKPLESSKEKDPFEPIPLHR